MSWLWYKTFDLLRHLDWGKRPPKMHSIHMVSNAFTGDSHLNDQIWDKQTKIAEIAESIQGETHAFFM